MDTLSEIIKISPESATRLAQEGSQYKFIINLRFDFFKKEFEYQFYGLDTFLNQLGGSSNAVVQSFEGLGLPILMLWMVIFAKMISKQSKEDYKSFKEKQKREKLLEIKQEIEKRLAKQDTDQLRLDLEACENMLLED